ncbi:MAG: RNA 2'-phosphotransferase [Anaerolineae bacterium]
MSESRRRELQLRKLSKFLSLLLRHRPARFPIGLDEQGYADLDEVMRIVQGLPNFRWATIKDVEALLEQPGRQRFEIVEGDGGRRIRALYGHTALRPAYESIEPPDVLYHGTAPEALDAIRRDGIRPMQRQYVHLTPDPEAARSIALRHTPEPVILKIDAANAHRDGVAFYHPTEGIYLTEGIEPKYVQVPAQGRGIR